MLFYLLKVNLALGLLYIVYRLLFRQDTFFQLRRYTLLCIYLIAFLYPLPDISSWLSTKPNLTEIVVYYAGVIEPAITIETSTETHAAIDWISVGQILLWAVYLIGLSALIFRCVMELITVVRIRLSCERKEVSGIPVHILPGAEEPYSFFRWIFIHPSSHSPESLKEILVHEYTHVRQWHSLDVMIGEIVTIICWINPFAWLLKQEISINHEYIADQKVVHLGHNKKSYQYHLIGMEHTPKAAANLYNYFSVLPLKKRITMLNKKRTKSTRTMKYLVFIPLAAALLVVNNMDSMARVIKERGDIIPHIIQTLSPNDEKIYDTADVMPELPGGEAVFFKTIAQTIKYPVIALENRSVDRIVSTFVVEKDGSVSNIEIISGVVPILGKEVKRVISALPKWKPGEINGEPVRVRKHLTAVFRLQGDYNTYSPPSGETPSEDEVVVVGYLSDDQPGDKLYTKVDKMPEFPGGDRELLNFVKENIQYPAELKEKGIRGRVVVSFIVEADGSIKGGEIERSINPVLDQEALRIVKIMPQWTPGKHEGKPVRVKYTMPIQFR